MRQLSTAEIKAIGTDVFCILAVHTDLLFSSRLVIAHEVEIMLTHAMKEGEHVLREHFAKEEWVNADGSPISR